MVQMLRACFKRIAQKIFTDVPSTNEIKNINRKVPKQEKNYNNYFANYKNNSNQMLKVCQEWMLLLYGKFRGKS
jgi:FtsZ-interacting cell division protein YlmF